MTRRDNLKRSVEDLRSQVDDARQQTDLAMEELRKAEALDSRDKPERGPDYPPADGNVFSLAQLARA